MSGLLSSFAAYSAKAIKDVEKSISIGRSSIEKEPFSSPGKSIVVDPHLWSFAGGLYFNVPKQVGFNVLRYLVKRDSLLGTIILTRLRQLRAFSQPVTKDQMSRNDGRGFRVALKKDAGSYTKAVENREQELTDFMYNCGELGIRTYDKNFFIFMWKFMQDRLILDQACFERVFNRKGDLSQFFTVDGATIRKANTKQYSHVQVIDDVVVTTYDEKELAFCAENISTDVTKGGYGESEIEMALRDVMSDLGIKAMNERQFRPGSMPKGVIVVEGAELGDEQIQSLELRWRKQALSNRGRHRIPIMSFPQGSKTHFIALPQAKDMELAKFKDDLTNILTALYGMDPVNRPQ